MASLFTVIPDFVVSLIHAFLYLLSVVGTSVLSGKYNALRSISYS